MADTSFVSKVTEIVTTWLQPVNDKVYKGRDPNFGVTTGSADTQVLALATGSLYTSAADGDTFLIKAGFTNTGAATLKVGGTVAVAWEKDGAALSAGDVTADHLYWVIRVGSTWQLK